MPHFQRGERSGSTQSAMSKGEQRRKKLFHGLDFQTLCDSKPQRLRPEDDKVAELKKQDFFAQLRMNSSALQSRRRDDTPIASELYLTSSQLTESVPIVSSQYTSEITAAGKSSGQGTETDSNRYTTSATGIETEDLTSGCREPTVEGTTATASQQFLQPQPVHTSSDKVSALRKRNKYLSSTAKFDASEMPRFPSDISAINSSDSTALKKTAEKTPQKSTDFKVPESPSKRHVKGHRRGNLEPKNSTKLFTTGFVEVVDVFPQMSTIRPDSADPARTSVLSQMEAEKNSDDLETNVENKQEPYHIKTSTPNKVTDKDGLQFFEFDISSVGADSGDDLLQLKSSREINSEEIINLSNIMVEPEQDPLSRHNELKKTTSEETTETNDNTKTLRANIFLVRGNESVSGEKILNDQLLDKASSVPLQSPENNFVLKRPVKEKKIAKESNRKSHIKHRLKGKVRGERRNIPFSRLSRDLASRATIYKKRKPWHRGMSTVSAGYRRMNITAEPVCAAIQSQDSGFTNADGTREVCPLTKCFTCPLANVWSLQCIEKNFMNYQDFIKTIPYDELPLPMDPE